MPDYEPHITVMDCRTKKAYDEDMAYIERQQYMRDQVFNRMADSLGIKDLWEQKQKNPETLPKDLPETTDAILNAMHNVEHDMQHMDFDTVKECAEHIRWDCPPAQKMAKQLGVLEQWNTLTLPIRDSYFSLQAAHTDENTGKSIPPQLVEKENLNDYGPVEWTTVRTIDITQDQYDKLRAVEDLHSNIRKGLEKPIFDKYTPGSYEFVQNPKGETYVHAKPDFADAPDEIYFKKTYGDHEFSKREITHLLEGDEITIDMRSGEHPVKLREGTIHGHEYFGIQRTDIDKERRLPQTPEDTISQPAQSKEID